MIMSGDKVAIRAIFYNLCGKGLRVRTAAKESKYALKSCCSESVPRKCALLQRDNAQEPITNMTKCKLRELERLEVLLHPPCSIEPQIITFFRVVAHFLHI